MNESLETKYLTAITAFTTFLMGYIDAYTFVEKSEVFASAQTGNVVILISRLTEGQWVDAILNLSTFLGFALGAFIGQAMLDFFKNYGMKKYFIFLSIQIIYLLILALSQEILSSNILVFLLGFLAGYELTLFRQFGKTTVNNGIMTGNVKNLMNHFYKMIFKKDNKSTYEVKILFISFFIFMFGIGLGTLAIKIGPIYNLWGALLINVIFYCWLKIKIKNTKSNMQI